MGAGTSTTSSATLAAAAATTPPPLAAAGSSELRLADHFPRHPKPCRKPADAFFTCFYEKGQQPPEGDKDAGRKALVECEPLMRKYDACMYKLEKKKPQDLIRVQEEYRVHGKPYGAAEA